MHENNSSIIDLIYYDESDGTSGYPHHGSVYYKALTIGTSGGGTTTVPGDVNHDGHVDITDLSILLSNYATTNVSCDFNTDGTVNIVDLSILLSHYGI